MHVLFRELAQQMGIQLGRAVLPENIDICLNLAIDKKVKSIIEENVGNVANESNVVRRNADISPFNALRTLYNKQTITKGITGLGTEIYPFKVSIDDTNVEVYTGFKVSYDGNILHDCRIIEQENLGVTLRDFCNRATKDSPICIINHSDGKLNIEVITGRSQVNVPKAIQYLYIEQPKKVYFDENESINNINCNLPSALHNEIVTIAVDIYLQSIGGQKK